MSTVDVSSDVVALFQADLAKGPRLPDPSPEPVAKADDDETPVEATPEAKPDEAEPVEAAPETEVEDESPAEGEELADDAPVEMFADFAKALGHEEKELLESIKVPGLDGKPVTLANVLEDWRSAGSTGVLKTQLEAKYAEFDGKIRQYESERDQEFGKVQALSQKLMSLVELDRKVDWAKLKEENPQEWSVRMHEANLRHQAMREALDAQNQEQTRLQQGVVEQRKKWMADEATKFFQTRPDLLATRKEFANELNAYVVGAGFTAEEMGDVLPDHRVLQMVWKAMQYDKLQKKAPLTAKKLREVQQRTPVAVVRPVTPRSPIKDPKAEKKKQLEAQHRKNGSVASLAALYEQQLTGGGS